MSRPIDHMRWHIRWRRPPGWTIVSRVQECCDVREVADQQRSVLRAVLWINAAMFVIESMSGVLARSTALLSDSMDMLGDALVYGFSLYAVSRGPGWQARAALLKGMLMGAFAAGVLVQAGFKIAYGLAPAVEVMGTVGLLALGANLVCLGLLRRRRGDDINMRSAWVCSRNDVIGNVAVLLAAAAVAVTGSPWPDIVVGLAIAGIFACSAVQVVREATGRIARVR
jgi:Co/Zn/Cd efflux system component